jgi:hypothetical protein
MQCDTVAMISEFFEFEFAEEGYTFYDRPLTKFPGLWPRIF